MRWILALLPLFLVVLTVISSSSDADFVVHKEVPGALLKAATLDLSSRDTANDGKISALFEAVSLAPGGFSVRTVRILDEGSVPAPIEISFGSIDDAGFLCSKLQLKILSDWHEVYSGKLTDLSLKTETEKGKKDLLFVLSLDQDNNNSGDFCRGDFLFTSHLSPKGGFQVKRKLTNYISVSGSKP